MCGFVGTLRTDGAAPRPADLARGVAALAHRGPDGGGEYASGLFAGAHRRLAIVDPAGGAQPMLRNGRALFLNGELFDFPEHRERLRSMGERFATRSDTEVLLAMLGREGVGALAGVNGMFAMARFEEGSGELLLARDPFGIKPLLVRAGEGEISFASELEGLLALPGPAPRLDLDALVERLAFQFPLGGRSLVAGIRSLPPGGWLRAGGGEPTREGRYAASAPAPSPRERSEEDWAEELRALIVNSVRGSLRADAPLGVALSGGLDSSLVAGVAARLSGRPLPAFHGYFDEGAAFDERGHARRAAAEAGLHLREVRIGPEDLLANLRELAVRLEGPIAGPGALPQLLVAARAAEEVGVILNGQGADEVFGGYARHRIALLHAAGRLDPERLPEDLAAYGPLARRLSGVDGDGSFADGFFRMVYRGEGVRGLLGPRLAAAFEDYRPQEAFREVFGDEGEDPRRRITRFERRYLLPALLHVEDRVSMARSLESRVPLLSPRILEFAARAPAELLFGPDELKRLLRLAARGIAPPSAVARRDKMGFPVPLARWARGPLREPLLARLREGPLVDLGILAPGAPEQLVGRAGEHGRHLWFFLLLSEWMAATGVRP